MSLVIRPLVIEENYTYYQADQSTHSSRQRLIITGAKHYARQRGVGIYVKIVFK